MGRYFLHTVLPIPSGWIGSPPAVVQTAYRAYAGVRWFHDSGDVCSVVTCRRSGSRAVCTTAGFFVPLHVADELMAWSSGKKGS